MHLLSSPQLDTPKSEHSFFSGTLPLHEALFCLAPASDGLNGLQLRLTLITVQGRVSGVGYTTHLSSVEKLTLCGLETKGPFNSDPKKSDCPDCLQVYSEEFKLTGSGPETMHPRKPRPEGRTRLVPAFYFIDLGNLSTIDRRMELLSQASIYFDSIWFIDGKFLNHWTKPKPKEPHIPSVPVAIFHNQQWWDIMVVPQSVINQALDEVRQEGMKEATKPRWSL